MTRAAVVEVSNLRKTYGSTVAVEDVSFEVFEGEIFGLIGPNGAGKTTTMECVEGIRKADGGTTSVLGLDPRKDARALQDRIGVQLQEAQLQKRVAIIEHGRLIEMGTPKDLVRKHCPQRGVVFSSDREGVADALGRIPGVESVRAVGPTYTIGGSGEGFVTAVIQFHCGQCASRPRLSHRDPDAGGCLPQADRARHTGLTPCCAAS